MLVPSDGPMVQGPGGSRFSCGFISFTFATTAVAMACHCAIFMRKKLQGVDLQVADHGMIHPRNPPENSYDNDNCQKQAFEDISQNLLYVKNEKEL